MNIPIIRKCHSETGGYPQKHFISTRKKEGVEMRVPNYSEDERQLVNIHVLRLVLGKYILRLLRL